MSNLKYRAVMVSMTLSSWMGSTAEGESCARAYIDECSGMIKLILI